MKPIAVALCVLIVVGTAATLRADENADPTGVWTWVDNPRAKSIETNELTLKRDGDKLSGSWFRYNSAFPRLPKAGQAGIRRNATYRITDGRFEDGRVSFKLVRSFNGRKSVTTYTGRVEGDLIKGTIKFGPKSSRDWEAKRAEH